MECIVRVDATGVGRGRNLGVQEVISIIITTTVNPLAMGHFGWVNAFLTLPDQKGRKILPKFLLYIWSNELSHFN